jgi:hypothetical protein
MSDDTTTVNVLDIEGLTAKVTTIREHWYGTTRVELFDEDLQLIHERNYQWSQRMNDDLRWERINRDIATDIQNWRN